MMIWTATKSGSNLVRMACGFDGVGPVEDVLLEGHLQEVPLLRLAQRLHAQLHRLRKQQVSQVHRAFMKL